MGGLARTVSAVEQQVGEPEPESFETLSVIEHETVSGGRKRSRRSGRAESDVTTGAGSEGKEASAAPSRPRRKKAAATKKTEGGAELASLVVELANLLAQTVYGPQAVMNPIERGMIEPALSNILERTPPETIQRFLGISDLLMLGMGSALWLSRLRKVREKEEGGEKEVIEPTSSAVEEGEVELGKADIELPELDNLWVTKLG